jgi:hypothetical protein
LIREKLPHSVTLKNHVASPRAFLAKSREQHMTKTVTFYRPVGPEELKLIEASGWKSFPPRLPEQRFSIP